MNGDIREVSIRREELEDGAGGHVEGYAIRVWVKDGDDDRLGVTIQGPREGVDGNLGEILYAEPIASWIELVMGNR